MIERLFGTTNTQLIFNLLGNTQATEPLDADAFRHPEVERTKVSVRYDPFDLGVAYAYVQGRWVKCISQLLQRLRDLEGQNVLNSLGQTSSSAPQIQIQVQTQTEPRSPSLQTLAPIQPNPALVLDLSQIPLFEEYR